MSQEWAVAHDLQHYSSVSSGPRGGLACSRQVPRDCWSLTCWYLTSSSYLGGAWGRDRVCTLQVETRKTNLKLDPRSRGLKGREAQVFWGLRNKKCTVETGVGWSYAASAAVPAWLHAGVDGACCPGSPRPGLEAPLSVTTWGTLGKVPDLSESQHPHL